MTDRELAASMQAKGVELLRATYSWDAIAARTVDVYDDARTGVRG